MKAAYSIREVWAALQTVETVDDGLWDARSLHGRHDQAGEGVRRGLREHAGAVEGGRGHCRRLFWTRASSPSRRSPPSSRRKATREELLEAERLFELDRTSYPELVEAEKELGELAEVYAVYVAHKQALDAHADVLGGADLKKLHAVSADFTERAESMAETALGKNPCSSSWRSGWRRSKTPAAHGGAQVRRVAAAALGAARADHSPARGFRRGSQDVHARGSVRAGAAPVPRARDGDASRRRRSSRSRRTSRGSRRCGRSKSSSSSST